MTTEERVRRLIAKYFPSFRVQSIVVPKQGLDHLAVIVNDAFVFRFPRKARYKRIFADETLLLEWIQPQVSLPVPRYEILAADRSCGAYPLLSGVRLSPDMFGRWNRKQQQQAAEDFAQFLSLLHALPAQVARRRFHVPVSSLQRSVVSWKRNYHTHVASMLTPAERSRCEEILAAFSSPIFRKVPAVLSHNDLYSEHILADPKRCRISGIIDFSDRAIGDPAGDIAKCWEYGQTYVTDVREKYVSARSDPTMLERSLAYYQRAQMAWVMFAAKGVDDISKALPSLRAALKIRL